MKHCQFPQYGHTNVFIYQESEPLPKQCYSPLHTWVLYGKSLKKLTLSPKNYFALILYVANAHNTVPAVPWSATGTI